MRTKLKKTVVGFVGDERFGSFSSFSSGRRAAVCRFGKLFWGMDNQGVAVGFRSTADIYAGREYVRLVVEAPPPKEW